jgi:outer membrane receptor protein involved in Fe transport
VAGGGNGFATRATVNLPLVQDRLALRANAYHRTDPGYIDDVRGGRRETNEAKVSGGRAQLLWTPDKDVSVRFSALAQNLSGDGLANGGVDVDPATLRPLYGAMTQSRAAGTGLLKLKYRLYDLTVNADLGGATLVSTTSYGTLRLNENVDVTNAFGPLLNPLLGVPDGGYSIHQPIALDKATQELRLQSNGNQVLDWRVGLFYTRERSTDGQDLLAFDASTGTPIDLPTLSRGMIGPARFTEWAGYGDVTWHATPRLSILLGARYSHDRTTFTQTTEGLITGVTDFTTRGSDTPTTYLVNPSYRFSDDVMGYLRVASGFRPGGPNVGVPPALGAPVTFGPDKLVSYEAGLKTSFLQRRMDLDVALFYIDWRQIQLATQQGAFSFLGNGGKASSRGAELSWTFRPATGLSLWANATWTQARLEADTPEGGVYGLKGETLPYVPRWNASAGADYNFPLGGGGWSGFVGGSYSYVGTRQSDFNPVPAPRIRLPSYSSLDLHAGVNYEHWTVQLYARNLADKRGIASISPATLDPLGSPFMAAYQTPRTVGLSASVEF